MLAGCHDTSAVQLVEGPQIAVTGPLGIDTSGTECIVNPLHYRPISVIALNHRFDVGHARLLCIDLHAPLSHAVRPLPPTETVDLVDVFAGTIHTDISLGGAGKVIHFIHQIHQG